MEIKFRTDDLVTITQAAKDLGCARLTIYRWIRAGKIVSADVSGSPYILKTEVARLKQERAAAVAALSGSLPTQKPQQEVKT